MDPGLILRYLYKMQLSETPEQVNGSAMELISLLRNTLSDRNDIFNEPGEDLQFIIRDLQQIIDVRTLERKLYYLNRSIKSLTEIKTVPFSDLNLNRWKDYEDLKTDSLWIFSKRDRTGSHSGKYWGNFIPQIPNQLLRRYTKKGDWVLDPFAGSGTTLIECKLLGRNALGVDISPDAAAEALQKIEEQASGKSESSIYMQCGNSLNYNFSDFLCSRGIENFQFIIMHPPYWDIIKFSEDPQDLSNCSSAKDYINMIGAATDNVYKHLEEGRYLAVVIGDKYNRGEWIPLGFYAMQEMMKRGMKLKSVIIKNFDETRGKQQQKELWRYRALAGGFYIFKHEYIFLFQKPKSKVHKKELAEAAAEET